MKPQETAVPNAATVLSGIELVARQHLGFAGSLAADSRLVTTLELDSLRLLTLVIEVENHFAVALEEGQEQAIETAGELAAAVRAKLLAQRDSLGSR